MLFFRAEGDMKDSYTIHEIASLYGVGPDAVSYTHLTLTTILLV